MSAFAIEIVFSSAPPEPDAVRSRSLFHHGLSDDEGDGYDPAERVAIHAAAPLDCECCDGVGLFLGSSRCPACKGSGVQAPHHSDVIDRRYRASLVRELRPGEQLPW